jgi:hypothetical protein
LLGAEEKGVAEPAIGIFGGCGVRSLAGWDSEEAVQLEDRFQEPIHILLAEGFRPA